MGNWCQTNNSSQKAEIAVNPGKSHSTQATPNNLATTGSQSQSTANNQNHPNDRKINDANAYPASEIVMKNTRGEDVKGEWVESSQVNQADKKKLDDLLKPEDSDEEK